MESERRKTTGTHRHCLISPKARELEQNKGVSLSEQPNVNDPLAVHQLSYLNGPGGSGKTTRAIELFRINHPVVLTPTYRLAKDMRERNVKSQTNHSLFRWNGQKDWTPERMGQKHIPKLIIWDEICTVPRHILQIFLEWLIYRDVQVICCGDHGEPPPIVGEMPHSWLIDRTDYYEEITLNHRAKDSKLKKLKKGIRLESDAVACKKMKK